MQQPGIELEQEGAVGWIWMNRPDVHNAFDASLIEELSTAFRQLAQTDQVRVIVLGGRGKSFSAGAQVQWMQQQGAASFEENVADARRLADLFQTIANCSKVTIARVQGAALGGGLGLVAACDLAIGATSATFATSEVRLGLIPSVISPYVLRAVGERQSRRLFVTAERIDAVTAHAIGLLHAVVEPDKLDNRVREFVSLVVAGAPKAQSEAKQLVSAVAGKVISSELVDDTVQRIAQRRADPEAAEGLAAFLGKRPPSWAQQG
jgi:methylglutaconyl-CoA hydratase